jgi:hypothetical protein
VFFFLHVGTKALREQGYGLNFLMLVEELQRSSRYLEFYAASDGYKSQ